MFMLCAYNFFRAITLDPGTCPKPASDTELKDVSRPLWHDTDSNKHIRQIIEELASTGRLNSQTFCISCMARKPLRAKHCRVCDRCTARFDHHCPWVWNCVGVKNHRQFLSFVITLVIGVGLFDYLTYAYFSNALQSWPSDHPAGVIIAKSFIALPGDSEDIPTISSSCILPNAVCKATATDPFLFVVAAWATLQLLWTFVLLASQVWQVARQMTTLEVTNLGRYGYLGGRGGSSLAAQQGHAHSHEGHETTHAHGAKGCWGFLLNILGFDRFTKGKARQGLARASKASNPFDLGMMANCRDFWTTGGELGVEYQTLYDVPPEGFAVARERRMAEERERGAEYGGRRKGKGLLMGLGLGRSNSGYQPIRMDDQV